MAAVAMDARYAGECVVCGERFPQGTKIVFDLASRKARHYACGGPPRAQQRVNGGRATAYERRDERDEPPNVQADDASIAQAQALFDAAPATTRGLLGELRATMRQLVLRQCRPELFEAVLALALDDALKRTREVEEPDVRANDVGVGARVGIPLEDVFGNLDDDDPQARHYADPTLGRDREREATERAAMLEEPERVEEPEKYNDNVDVEPAPRGLAAWLKPRKGA